jgi:hypothetical protein
VTDPDSYYSFQRHLEQYTVSDFLEFRASKRLTLNPDFQRRDIWKPAAKVYFIDTILRGYPIPKMYFRTMIDPATQSSVREVVDGQQRLRAIFAFADNDLRLTRRAGEFAGLRYRDLDESRQSRFLSYSFAAEQLINAGDRQVLEIFARLNTYSASLTPAELRNAEFQGEFKWTVHETALRWERLWTDFRVVSVRDRARMADDTLVAMMALAVLQGVTGGEAPVLRRAYRNLDDTWAFADEVAALIDDTLSVILERMPGAIVGPLANAPHFLMLFMATAHTLHGLGQRTVDWLPGAPLPPRPPAPASQDEWDAVRDRFLDLGAVIQEREAPENAELARLWRASRGATVNLRSREVRFPFYLKAFQL